MQNSGVGDALPNPDQGRNYTLVMHKTQPQGLFIIRGKYS